MNVINQTGSQVFSLARYRALLKTYLVENGKTLSLYTVALIGILMIYGAIIAKVCIDNPQSLGYNELGVQASMIMFWGAAGQICTIVSGSFMFSSMQTRASRISTLMLPASMLEKYLVRLTVYLGVFGICFFIATLLSDITRILCTGGHGTLVYTFYIFTKIYELDALSIVKILLYGLGMILASHATYTLGSALWPKHSFFKTAVILIALSFFIVPFFIVIDISEIIIHDTDAYKWLFIAFEYIWVVTCYTLAWWRFKNTQIVQRFMSI